MPSSTAVADARAGNAVVGVMVQTPASWPASVTGIAKSIATAPDADASASAARRVHSGSPSAFVPPVSQTPSPALLSAASPVLLTTGLTSATVTAGPNSDVAPYDPPPRSSVTVALSTAPTGTATSRVQLWTPVPALVTVHAPTRVWPSPKPDASAPSSGLVNSSIL